MNFINFLTSGASMMNFNLQKPVIVSNTKCLTRQENKMKDKKQIQQEQTIHLNDPNVLNTSQNQLLNQHHQQLINQYMQMNIQMLNQKLQLIQQADKNKNDQLNQHQELISRKKKIKKFNSCDHKNQEHYAKGMCNNCYHKFGRNKKPWKCPHNKLYAKGMCQNCYINQYNMNRKKGKVEEIKQSMNQEEEDQESNEEISEKKQILSNSNSFQKKTQE